MQSSPEKNELLSSVTRFGTFELDSASGELRRQGRKVRLPNQPFQVLRLLVQRAGGVVTREELQLMLWPGDALVDAEIGLNSAIRQLRCVLGDIARNPLFVETVPRRGYRFIATPWCSGLSGSVDVWRQAFEGPCGESILPAHIGKRPLHEIPLKLTPQEKHQLGPQRSPTCDFQEAYLRARYYWNHRTTEALLRSYQFLSLALDKKPESAEANAALADWYLSAEIEGLLPEREAIAHAKVAAVQAFQLGPGMAEVHASLGRIALRECNLLRAHAEFETAARLNPDLVDPLLLSALTHSYLVRPEEARKRIDRARQLDPFSPRMCIVAAIAAYTAGDYAAAAEQSQEALALETHMASAFYVLALSQFQMGLIESALENFVSAARENPHHPAPLAAIAKVHAREGRTADALAIVKQMIEKATRAEVSPYYFAEVYLALGDVEKALGYLRRSFDLRLPDIIGIAVDPWLRSLHGHSAFEEMVTSLGISSRPPK